MKSSLEFQMLCDAYKENSSFSSPLTKSEAFKLAHKNAGQHKDLYLGAPKFEGFEVVI